MKRKYKRKRKRKPFRKIICVLLVLTALIILGVVGYNIALERMHPIKYQNIAQAHASAYDVDVELVLAIIRCESDFDPEAKSNAGAKGLMQLTEETFYDVRKMVGDGEDITYESHWNDPQTNIKYGTKYISFLIEYYKGDKIAALAAYNAGLKNVNDWLGADKQLQIDEIEFSETEDYVKKVLESEINYKELLKKEK